MPGDINKQDNVNNADAQWLLEHLAQKTGKQLGTEQGYTLEEFKEQCKVVNPSGTVFSCADASYIYSHVKEHVNSTNNYPITLPEPEPEPGTGGYQFADKTALQTAVNEWVSDKSTALSTYGEINTWDTSLVTNMYQLFSNKLTFNDDISNWNTSNVTNMRYMFFKATAFNEEIGNWNTSNVTDMAGIFYSASAFNQPIGIWDVSNVTNMVVMFKQAEAFNQPINTQQVTVNNNTYTAWDVSNVTGMSRMFSGAYAFNQEIGNWNVSNVSGMEYMFKQATAFNQDISIWDVSSVTMFDDMFIDATLMNAAPWNAPNTPDVTWFTIPEPDSAAGVPTGSTPTSTVQFYYNNNNFIPVQTTLINTYALTDISSINIISAKMGGESINKGTPIAADVIAAGNLGEWYFGITEPNNHTYCQTVKIKFNINTSGYITILAVRARWMPPGEYDHNIALNILWDNNVGISNDVVDKRHNWVDGVNVPGYGVKDLYIEYQV